MGPDQRPQSSVDADPRGPLHDQHYPQSVPPEHDPRQPPFVGHDRREPYLHHPPQHTPIPGHRPDQGPPGPSGPGIEDQYPPHRSDIAQGHSDKQRPSIDNPFNGPRHPPIPQQEPTHPQLIPQAQEPRHPAMVGPPSHQVPPPQQGYHPESHPQNMDGRAPYPPPGNQTQGYGSDIRRGPDGYHPDDHQRGKGPYSYPGPPPSWPGRESTPSQGWDSMDPRYREQESNATHRRVESAPEYVVRPMLDNKGHPQSSNEFSGHGSAPNAANPQMMGRPGHPSQLMVMTGAEMVNRHETSSPAVGGARETPPGSARSLSPDSLANPQGDHKRRGWKTNGRAGGEYGGPTELAPTAADVSPGPQTPNSANDLLPGQQTPSKRKGRKPKSEKDRDMDRKDIVQRQWSVITPETHRLSTGNAEALESRPPQPMDVKEKAHAIAEQQQLQRDVHMESAQISMSRSENERTAGADLGMQNGRFAEGIAPPSKPGYEHQNQMPGQYDRPPAHYQYPPGSAEEFEYLQRRQQQQEQQLQEQQLQQQQRPQQQQPQPHAGQYQHPSQLHPAHPFGAPYSGPQYGHQKGQDPEYDAHRAGAGKVLANTPAAVAPGQDPETVQHLEAAVANTLVNIRFQSPDSTSHLEGEPHKRARMDSPTRPTDSFADHPHRHPASGGERDMHSRMPTRDMQPGAAGRPDLAQVEQDTVMILQTMRNERMEHEESGMHHSQRGGHHPMELQQGYAPRSPSPRVQSGAQDRRGPYAQQHHGVQHLAQSEHGPVDPHQFDAVPVTREQGLQQQRQQRHQQSRPTQQAPPQIHPSYGRGQGYPHNEPVAFDSHHGAMNEDPKARQRHPPLSGPMGQPREAAYPHATPVHGSDEQDRFRSPVGYAPGAFPSRQ
ncbi:hypothetical protein EDD21DRAFT_134735 [Dissophora ornata]|nr:hypothetical protein EDD21DRAFT_134735 [Dissophora ornata]